MDRRDLSPSPDGSGRPPYRGTNTSSFASLPSMGSASTIRPFSGAPHFNFGGGSSASMNPSSSFFGGGGGGGMGTALGSQGGNSLFGSASLAAMGRAVSEGSSSGRNVGGYGGYGSGGDAGYGGKSMFSASSPSLDDRNNQTAVLTSQLQSARTQITRLERLLDEEREKSEKLLEQAEKDKTALEGRVGELEDAVTKYQNFVAELMKLLLEAERYFNQSGLQLESAVRRWGDAGGQRDIATVMAGTKEAVARVLDFYMPRDERAMEAGEGGRGGV